MTTTMNTELDRLIHRATVKTRAAIGAVRDASEATEKANEVGLAELRDMGTWENTSQNQRQALALLWSAREQLGAEYADDLDALDRMMEIVDGLMAGTADPSEINLPLPCAVKTTHVDCKRNLADGDRYADRPWMLGDCNDDTPRTMRTTGCFERLTCRGAEHEQPHCRECYRPMKSGALDTRGVGANQRGWRCEPCNRSTWWEESGADARTPQRVLI